MNKKRQTFDKIAGYYSGEENKDVVRTQLENDPDSREVFYWVDLIWTKLTPKLVHSGHIQRLTQMKIGQGDRTAPSFMLRTVKYAAVVLLVLSVSAIAYFYSKEEGRFVEIYSGIGEVKVIELPDGSKAWLNAKSHMKYPENFNGNSRDLTMDGEIYFEVKKDKEHPFIVNSDHVQIAVLGTSFMLSCYENEPVVDTYLEEGSVRLELKKLKKKMILVPGDEITYEKETAAVTRENHPHSVLDSWRFGRLTFYNESLFEIARKLERKFGKEITIRDKKVGNMKYTADFESENLEQILNFFGEGSKLSYHTNETGYVITKK